MLNKFIIALIFYSLIYLVKSKYLIHVDNDSWEFEEKDDTIGSLEEDDTLQLVQVLFRHGHRTNDPSSLYPKDPYRNETYYPHGLGQLTNEGKRREYQLGKLLRQRYGSFLGETYTPDLVEPLSSDSNRTKASLQLVLAGLFPPTGDQVWDEGFSWQPIPYNYIPRERDDTFFGIFCPNTKRLLDRYLKSRKMRYHMARDKELFNYLEEHTGWKINNYMTTFLIYVGLKTEEEYGFGLPEWSGVVYPQPLERAAIDFYYMYTGTTELRRLSVGTLLKMMVDRAQAKAQNQLSPKDRKLFLYSGHELNVAFLLETLDIFEPHLPPYGSHVMLELHKINGVHGLKIYYEDYTGKGPKLMKLPACNEFCPLNKFHSLIEEYLPIPGQCGWEN